MTFKRLFSTQPIRKLFSEILKENSGTILALGVIGGGTFGIGLYVNQMKVYEEKLNVVQRDVMVAEERAKRDVMVAEEKIMVAEERAKKEALQLLYNIFTQEEYKDAKKKLLSQKNSSNEE